MLKKTTLHRFYDLLSTHSTLTKIETLFESEDIFVHPTYTSNLNGQRRSLADEYISSLDLTESSDTQKVINVIEMFLLEHENDEDFKVDSRLKQLNNLLERDGYRFENNKLVSINSTYAPLNLEEITTEHGIEHVKTEWERALSQADTDPEDAITATRSMLESTLKWILDEFEIPYTKKDSLSSLYKKVAEQLNLSPDQHGEDIFKQILGSISGVVNGLGSLRNEYGDSHGKGKNNYKPSTRHATFSINLSGTLCMYLLETYFSNINVNT